MPNNPRNKARYLTIDDIKNFKTAAEIAAMVKEELSPYSEQLKKISGQILEIYGNGSGNSGFLERMEKKQDERWDQSQDDKDNIHQALLNFVELVKPDQAWIADQRREAEDEKVRKALIEKILQKIYFGVKLIGSGTGVLLIRLAWVHFVLHRP